MGLHQPSDAQHFERCMVSVNRLKQRHSHFAVEDWIMDSGAFTAISSGRGHRAPGLYAHDIWRFRNCGRLLAAVSQDYMCEPHILDKTGLDVAEHQRLTIERYDALRNCLSPVGCGVYIMPVLQGYEAHEYISHIKQYKTRLEDWMWVGVGSVCKRNSRPEEIHEILSAIKTTYPSLRLHGFGIKTTALKDKRIRRLLYSADSMAWSYAARRQGGNANCWREARAFVNQIEAS